MSKAISMLDALQVLAQTEGFELTPEQEELIREAQGNAIADRATEELSSKFAEHTAEAVNESFAFASFVAGSCDGAKQNKRGRGTDQVYVQQFAVETPNGRLTVRLESE